jgi:hypothetical protein
MIILLYTGINYQATIGLLGCKIKQHIDGLKEYLKEYYFLSVNFVYHHQQRLEKVWDTPLKRLASQNKQRILLLFSVSHLG